MLSSMDITNTILGGVTILVPIAFFIWRLDKRAEERTNTSEQRTNTRHAELVTQIGALVSILLQGQDWLQTQIVKLQEGQTQILGHLGRLETEMGELKARMDVLEARMDGLETEMGELKARMDILEKGQAKLAVEWAKAEIRLKHLEENSVTTQEKIDEIMGLANSTNAKTANLEGLVRGYLLREHGILSDAAAG